MRYQVLVSKSELASTARTLNAISMYVPSTSYDQYSGRFQNIKIYLCHTSRTTLSTTFTSNYDGNTPVLVYANADKTFSWPEGTWGTINFGTVFDYNGSGNVLIEVQWSGSPSGAIMVAPVTNTYDAVFAYNASATTATYSERRPVMRLHYSPPTLSVSATDALASEAGQTTGTWTITRTGDTNSALSIAFGLSGTATQTNDYTINKTSPIAMAAGQTSVSVTLTAVDDTVFDEGNETAILTLLPDSSYVIGTASATITITDNDYVPPIVSNQGATSLSTTSASVSGKTTSGQDVSAWICWGMTDGGTNSMGNWEHADYIGAVTQNVTFSKTLTGLATNQTYWYRCVASNVAGIGWASEVKSFSGTPVGGSWTPAAMTLAAWYDAADASTVQTSGSSVTNWLDKSGNNRHVSQANAFQQPSYNSNAVVFDGVTNLLKRSTAFIYANGSADIYIVGAIDGAAFDKRLFAESHSTNNNTWYSPLQSRREIDASMTSAYIRDDGNTIRLSNASILSASGALDLSTRKLYQARDTGSSVAHRVSGGSAVSLSYTRGTTTVNRFGLGGFPERPTLPDGGSFMRCDLNEFIVVPSLLSDADRQKMEGYLAHKWGLTASLPADHPYKDTRPGGAVATVANLAPTGIGDSAATFNAAMNASGTNYDVTVYYGATDGGTNAGAWGVSEYVGSWTNVSTNISCSVNSLLAGTRYSYTFAVSNASGVVWAKPSWTFTTVGSAPEVTVNHAVPHAWLGNWSWTNDYEAAVLDDPDGDGFSTWQEYWAGTDPQNSDSYLKIESVTFEGGNIVIKWESSAVGAGVPPLGIQARGDLLSGSWSNVGQKSLANGVNAWSNSAAQQLYYRLAVTNAP
jgi:hypothetical protein